MRVTPRGGAYLGKMPFVATKKVVFDQIVVTLAGRAAEAVLLGSASNGAESDFVQATELAFRARYSRGLYSNNLLSLSTIKLSQFAPPHAAWLRCERRYQKSLFVRKGDHSRQRKAGGACSPCTFGLSGNGRGGIGRSISSAHHHKP